MNRITKIILILFLCSITIFCGENSEINLKSIKFENNNKNIEVFLEFDDIVSNYSLNNKGNNIIIDIPDCFLDMSDMPISPDFNEINIITPMQLKKSPAVVRVIFILNKFLEHKAHTSGNKIILTINKSVSSEDNLEGILEKELNYNKKPFFYDAEKDNIEENNYLETQNINYGTDTNQSSEKNHSGEENINFNFSGMSIKDIFETLSNLTGYNIILDGEVRERNLNLFIQDLPVHDAIDLVVASAGLAKNKFNEKTFIISEKSKAEQIHQKRDQSIFRLVNAQADEVIDLIESNKKLSEKIKLENLSVDKRINAILAYDTKENLRLLEKIIKDFDKKNGQVTIELYLVEMRREDMNNFGFTFDQFPLSPKTMDILNLPSSINIYTKLEALESQDKANILSAPKIRVVHKKTAKIEIGDEIPVPYFTYEEAHKYLAGNTSDDVRVVEPLKKFETAKVGITLNVTPYVHDNKEVSMDLDIDVSDLIKVDNDGQLYTSTRNTQTYVRLKDRETAVLGGLIKQEERKENSRVPGLQNIPILRSIFKNRKSTIRNTEMVMFITPYFVNKDNDSKDIDVEDNKILSKDSDKEYYNVIGELKKISK